MTLQSVELKNSPAMIELICMQDVRQMLLSQIKVGSTTVATFNNINTGSWSKYQINTASLITTEASGNVTLNISGEKSAYCGKLCLCKDIQ